MDFFGIGLLELLVILVVALLVIGPKRLPDMAKQLGRLLTQARRSVEEARNTFMMDLEAEESSRGKLPSPVAESASEPMAEARRDDPPLA